MKIHRAAAGIDLIGSGNDSSINPFMAYVRKLCKDRGLDLKCNVYGTGEVDCVIRLSIFAEDSATNPEKMIAEAVKSIASMAKHIWPAATDTPQSEPYDFDALRHRNAKPPDWWMSEKAPSDPPPAPEEDPQLICG